MNNPCLPVVVSRFLCCFYFIEVIVELVFAGLFIVISGFVYKRSLRFLESDDVSRARERDYYLVLFFGGVILLFGVVSLVIGRRHFVLDGWKVFHAISVLFVLNIQLRLLNYASRHGGYGSGKGGLAVLKNSLSVGFFPWQGECCFLINFVQIVQLLSLLYFIF